MFWYHFGSIVGPSGGAYLLAGPGVAATQGTADTAIMVGASSLPLLAGAGSDDAVIWGATDHGARDALSRRDYRGHARRLELTARGEHSDRHEGPGLESERPLSRIRASILSNHCQGSGRRF